MEKSAASSGCKETTKCVMYRHCSVNTTGEVWIRRGVPSFRPPTRTVSKQSLRTLGQVQHHGDQTHPTRPLRTARPLGQPRSHQHLEQQPLVATCLFSSCRGIQLIPTSDTRERFVVVGTRHAAGCARAFVRWVE